MRCVPLLMISLCLFPLGCAPGYPDTAPVTGTVTIDGKTLGSGEVQFVSPNGDLATGRIYPDGVYRLTTFQPDDGALPGRHKVSIKSQQSAGLGMSSMLAAVPAEFEDPETSGLTAQVTKGMNRIDFNLKVNTRNDAEPGQETGQFGDSLARGRQ